MISLSDFKKLDIRTGEILEAEKVPDTDKLLRLIVDLGPEKRQIVTGMAEFYDPLYLIGKQVPILTNLEPRKFRGIESRGMILAVDVEGRPVLLHPDEKVPSGSIVR